MKKILLTLAAAVTFASAAHSQIIAGWTFETSLPTTAGPFAAEIGTGSALGFHAGTTAYSNPSGNGSAESFSSNGWAVGDYYQFTVSTVGFSNIVITWDQNGSGTGPANFDLSYSADGAAFSILTSYTVPSGVTWTAGAAVDPANTTFSYDLSGISAANGASTLVFRMVNASTTSIGGGTVATAGTGRVDNVYITAVPEPQEVALAIAGLLGVLIVMRRRNARVA